MLDKAQYLNQVEAAYKAQGQVSQIVGLYLTQPFAGTRRGTELAAMIRSGSRDLEELLRELYTAEKAAPRS